jgi:hypothetical protein
MPDQETIVQETTAQEWDEPLEELPPRPRRRLLGAGGNPVPLALLGVLLIACGFIAGALVEKGQSSTSSMAGSGAAGLAARFAALRGAAGAGTSGASGTSGANAGTASAGAAPAGGASAAAGLFGRSGEAGRSSIGGAGVTTGQVAYVSGSTLYVTNAEGNTVKVTTSPASSVTKTVKADVKDIHPGETVLVTGAAGANGSISTESIRAGGTGGGLSALFGGGSAGVGGSGGAASAGGGSGPALFGSGG